MKISFENLGMNLLYMDEARAFMEVRDVSIKEPSLGEPCGISNWHRHLWFRAQERAVSASGRKQDQSGEEDRGRGMRGSIGAGG